MQDFRSISSLQQSFCSTDVNETLGGTNVLGLHFVGWQSSPDGTISRVPRERGRKGFPRGEA